MVLGEAGKAVWHTFMAPRRWFVARGLRCRVMMFLGATWILMGWGAWTGASNPPEGLAFLAIPREVRTLLWAVPGAFAVWTGARMKGTSHALGWLAIAPVIRFFSYGLSWVLYLLPLNSPALAEYPHGWFIAGTYAAQITCVLVCASIPSGFYPATGQNEAEE